MSVYNVNVDYVNISRIGFGYWYFYMVAVLTGFAGGTYNFFLLNFR